MLNKERKAGKIHAPTRQADWLLLMSSWFALQYSFAAKMRKMRNMSDGIHFLWFLCLLAAN